MTPCCTSLNLHNPRSKKMKISQTTTTGSTSAKAENHSDHDKTSGAGSPHSGTADSAQPDPGTASTSLNTKDIGAGAS